MKVMLDRDAKLPNRAHKTDAGLYLYCREKKRIWPGQSAVFDTGVHIQLPHGYYGEVTSKSGLNINHGVVSHGGTIDEGYTGSIHAVLYNHGQEAVPFRAGDKICQLVVLPCVIEPVELVDELEETERGDAGFGSTGR